MLCSNIIKLHISYVIVFSVFMMTYKCTVFCLGKPNTLLAKTLRQEVAMKANQKEHRHTSSTALVEDALLKLNLNGNEHLPSMTAEVRAANRRRAGRNPKHPATTNFMVGIEEHIVCIKDYTIINTNFCCFLLGF